MNDQVYKGRIDDRRADDAGHVLFEDTFAGHFQRRTHDEMGPIDRANLPDRH